MKSSSTSYHSSGCFFPDLFGCRAFWSFFASRFFSRSAMTAGSFGSRPSSTKSSSESSCSAATSSSFASSSAPRLASSSSLSSNLGAE